MSVPTAPTNKPLTQRLATAYVDRVRYTLHKSTLKKLKQITILMIGFGLLGFALPLTAIVVAFFGIVESIRLSFPHLYPFNFDKKANLYLRLGTALYLLLGIAGIIFNWDSIANFMQPVFDWFSE